MTWCTKDKNGVAPPVAGAQPYTLWRYVGSAARAPGRTGRRISSTLRAITAGKIFDAASVPAATPTRRADRHASVGNLLLRRHGGAVGGAEVPASVTADHGASNTITVSWSAYPGATSYNVYGRDGDVAPAQERHAGTSYVDSGPTKLTATR